MNLIASLDTDGRVYTALTQVNTDSEVIIAYLTKLVSVLAQEDKDFRVNTPNLIRCMHRNQSLSQVSRLNPKVILPAPGSPTTGISTSTGGVAATPEVCD